MTLVIRDLLRQWALHTDGLLPRGCGSGSLSVRVPASPAARIGVEMTGVLRKAWRQEEGQDVAEYAVMLAVILAIAIGTIRVIGSHAGNVFASVGSAIQ